MSSDAQAAEPTPPTEKLRLLPDILPGYAVWIIWAISLIATIALRSSIDHLDYAVVNGATYGAIFASLISPFIWFVWFSKHPFAARRAVFGIVMGLLAFGILFVRIRGVDGSLVPTFAFAWDQPADRTLEKPLVAKPAEQPAATTEAPPEEVGFPGFLGPDRNAVLAGPKLARDWNAHPPKLIWKTKIGAGWAAFAAKNGRAVTLEQRGDEEWVTCYSVATGDVLWAHGIPGRHQEVMGGIGPRSTPTIDGDRVYTHGAFGALQCFELSTGRILWSHKMLDLVGVKEGEDQNAVLWGRSGSPLIYHDLCIVPGGGPNGKDARRVSLIAFDKETGKEVWRGGEQQISYSSPVAATLCGVEQILIVNEDTLAGHDPQTGRELWRFQWFGSSTANASTAQPLAVSGDRIFISKGYGGGMKLLQVTRDQDAWAVKDIISNSAVMKTKFTNVALIGDYAYALSDSILECINWTTGKPQWKKGRFGQGQLLAVGDVLLIQCESGEVAMVEANPEKQVELGRFPAIQGKTWNNPCVYGKYLLARNAEEAACYELRVEE